MTLVSFPILTNLLPTPGPLYLLFPLPGTLFSTSSSDWLLLYFRSQPRCSFLEGPFLPVQPHPSVPCGPRGPLSLFLIGVGPPLNRFIYLFVCFPPFSPSGCEFQESPGLVCLSFYTALRAQPRSSIQQAPHRNISLPIALRFNLEVSPTHYMLNQSRFKLGTIT